MYNMSQQLFCFKFNKSKLFSLAEDNGSEVVFTFLSEKSAEGFLEELILYGLELDPAFFVLTGKKEHAILQKYDVLENPTIKILATAAYPPTLVFTTNA